MAPSVYTLRRSSRVRLLVVIKKLTKNTKKSIETSLLNRHTHKTDFLAYYMAMVLKNVR